MITYLPALPGGDGTFRMRWASDQTPPLTFRVYLDGVLLSTINSNVASGEVLIQLSPGEDKFFEVLEKDCQIPTIAFPGRFTLGWEGDTDVETYIIRVFENLAWTEKDRILNDGRGYFTWVSSYYADEFSFQARVVGLDSAGNEGTAAEKSVIQVRHPPVPVVTATVNLDLTLNLVVS